MLVRPSEAISDSSCASVKAEGWHSVWFGPRRLFFVHLIVWQVPRVAVLVRPAEAKFGLSHRLTAAEDGSVGSAQRGRI